jgi:hypothetical protein
VVAAAHLRPAQTAYSVPLEEMAVTDRPTQSAEPALHMPAAAADRTATTPPAPASQAVQAVLAAADAEQETRWLQ